jgi:hypothetical protein
MRMHAYNKVTMDLDSIISTHRGVPLVQHNHLFVRRL